MLVLPSLSPYESFVCSTTPQGAGECLGILNPVYLIVFLFSVGGTILFFFGLFGRDFILKPLFIFGLLLLEWNVYGGTFGYLSSEWCASATIRTPCIAYHPEFYLLTAVGGALIIFLQSATYLRFSSSVARDTALESSGGCEG